MASEVQVRTFLSVNKDNLRHNPGQFQFTDDMTGALGPTPGAFVAVADGTDVDLSQLSDPGWIELWNQEPEGGAEVSWGVYDVENDKYIPVGMLKPGWRYPICLDELFGGEFQPSAVGTGTDLINNRLRIKVKDADTANVYVGAFQR